MGNGSPRPHSKATLLDAAVTTLASEELGGPAVPKGPLWGRLPSFLEVGAAAHTVWTLDPGSAPLNWLAFLLLPPPKQMPRAGVGWKQYLSN
jgi:hypothetical protein